MKSVIVLDLAFENDISELSDMFKGTEIEFEILQENGPGGGWPECMLTGEESVIREWLIENYCVEEDVDYHMGSAYFLEDSLKTSVNTTLTIH